MTDLKLGKAPAQYDERTLKLARYLCPQLSPPDTSGARAKTRNTPFGMFDNNVAGDCVLAGRGNLRRFWASLTDHPEPVTDIDCIDAYARLTGYNPTTGANDNGTNELDALNDWRTTPFAGETIDGFAAVNLHDDNLVRGVIYCFDGLYGGYQLPATAQDQLNAGQPFDYEPQFGSQAYPGSWGGHCMVEVDYDEDFVYLATWGQIQPATWAWVRQYRDEAYAVLASVDQLAANAKTAEGFDLDQLKTDLAAL